MKFNKLLLAGALIGGTFVGFSQSAQAEDATGTATAVIRAAITLTEDQGMDFGLITPNPAGDTVTITAGGVVSAVSGSDLAGSPAAGGFTATGTALSAVTISFSTGDVLADGGAGVDIPLGTFTHDAGGSPAFDAGGDLDFDVGAAITIGASQLAGTYSGNYTATVDYQ